MINHISAYEAFVILRNFFLFGMMIYWGYAFGRFTTRKICYFFRWLRSRMKKTAD